MSTLFSLVPVAPQMDSGSKPKLRDRDKMETEFQNNFSSNSLSDIKRVQIHFGRLIVMVTNQLDRNGVSLTEIVSELGIDLNSPAYNDNGERISDVFTFFSFISTSGYMPFYSIAMLESTVNKFAPECLEAVDAYKKEHLRPFLLKCLPDLDLECFDHGVLPDQVKLSIRIDREWDTTSLSDIEELTKSLAALLEIPPELLVIETLKEGSVIVEYRIPQAYRVTSLTFSQQKKLEQLSVLEFKCDGVVKVLVEDATDDEAQSEIRQCILGFFSSFDAEFIEKPNGDLGIATDKKLPSVPNILSVNATVAQYQAQCVAARLKEIGDIIEEEYQSQSELIEELMRREFLSITELIKKLVPPHVKRINAAGSIGAVSIVTSFVSGVFVACIPFVALCADTMYEIIRDRYFDHESGMKIIHLWFEIFSYDQWETFGKETKHKWKLKSYLGQLVVNQNELLN